MNFSHISVLRVEAVDALNIENERADGIYVDATAGGGGHSALVLERLSGRGRLICIDQDPDAIGVLTERFKDDSRVTIVRSNFAEIASVLESLGVDAIDGVLMDIGVSSHQLDCAERGFSYHSDAPLDMRMSQEGQSAADLVNSLAWQQLAEIFTRYGEEKFSARIAKLICQRREEKPIETTLELADIIRDAYPAAARRDGHPARKCFQALRIAVNDELGVLERGMQAAFDSLAVQGRIAVITFHSLEDRMVKRTMNEWAKGCICPPDFPQCVCGKKPRAAVVTRKPIIPSEQEISENARSRSSKLRIAEKLPQE